MKWAHAITQCGVYDAIPVPEELKGFVLKQARVGPSKTDLNVNILVL